MLKSQFVLDVACHASTVVNYRRMHQKTEETS